MRNILFALIAIATTGCSDFLAGYATVEGWEENHRVEAVVVVPPEREDTGDVVVDTDSVDTTEDTTGDTVDTTPPVENNHCYNMSFEEDMSTVNITVTNETNAGFIEFWVGDYSNHSDAFAVAQGFTALPWDLMLDMGAESLEDVSFAYVANDTFVWGPDTTGISADASILTPCY